LKTVISGSIAEIPKYEVNPRNIRFEDAGNYVFVGMRRAGKSYLLYQRIQELLSKGIKPHEILYVNFEDERSLTISSMLKMRGLSPQYKTLPEKSSKKRPNPSITLPTTAY